ncbi:MAG: hypothetical protein IH852_11915 [Bacteroidetes bacterium]|nr:hypothetical protein [Bacteroidota bacterium]
MDSLFNEFVNLRVPEISPEPGTQPQIIDEGHKCGLEIVNAIAFNFDMFDNDQQLLLKPLLQRPVTATSFVTPGGFFRVHYDPTGPNAPGYDLNLFAEALDSTYKFEIDFLGYDTPPGDSATNPNIHSEEYGGDNRYDVYIGNLGSGLYGFTKFEYEVEEGSNRFSSYMMIDNDFVNYFSPGISGAQVTVAHEFHHSIQGGNYIFRSEDTFFYEITSTAMEEFVFDDVNDYYAYIPSYFNNPETPLQRTTGYNTATWNIFLRDNFDYDIIKRQWELMPSLRAMIAINNSIFEYGSSFAREFNRYGIWMYFTNYRAVSGKYFEEGVNYPLIVPTSVVQFTPPSQILNMSGKAASHTFITFVIQGNNDSLVTIVSNGDVQNAVIGLNNFFDFNYTLYSDSSSGDRFLTENYSSMFRAGNPALWSVSEILNNLLVREDDASFSPPEGSTFAFPNPFTYGNGIIENINFSFNGRNGEKVDFAVYSTSMNLVYSSEHFVGPLTNNSLGLKWDVRGNDGEKLASGVYIYVIQKSDEITKGKVVIFN